MGRRWVRQAAAMGRGLEDKAAPKGPKPAGQHAAPPARRHLTQRRWVQAALLWPLCVGSWAQSTPPAPVPVPDTQGLEISDRVKRDAERPMYWIRRLGEQTAGQDKTAPERSAAEKAGLKGGDIIIKFGSKQIKNIYEQAGPKVEERVADLKAQKRAWLDANGVAMLDYTRNIINLEPFDQKFRDFGWEVVILKYGSLQQAAFREPGGETLRKWIDNCPNQLYSALVFQGGAAWRKRLLDEIGDQGAVTKLIESRSDDELARLMNNLGGHDLPSIIEA